MRRTGAHRGTSRSMARRSVRRRTRRCPASRSRTRCRRRSPSASRRSSACDSGPTPYSAVPVLAWVPAGSPVPAAVPLVVTLPIIERRSATSPAGSCDGARLSSGAPWTSRGARTAPLSIAAATWAMPSGENVSRPCPIASAASSVWPVGFGDVGRERRQAELRGQVQAVQPGHRRVVGRATGARPPG